MKVQGHNIDDLPFKAGLGVFGSWLGLILNILCIVAQFYIAVSPVKGQATAYDFFVQMLALPVVIVCFVGWKVLHKTKWVRLGEMDLLSGRRELDLAAAKQAEMTERASWGWWKKYYHLYAELIVGFTIGFAREYLWWEILPLKALFFFAALVWVRVCSNTT